MSNLKNSAPRGDRSMHQAFDDVIERRVVRSLVHDLRTPMAVLSAFFAPGSRIESTELRDRARAAFEQSTRLLDEFIDTVRSGLLEQPPALEEIHVGRFLLDVARMHRGAMRAAVPPITLKIRPAKLRAVLDTRRLRRVLNNLIGNAVQHSGANRLVLGARVVRGELVIVVADDGCGLSTEQRHLDESQPRPGERRKVVDDGHGSLVKRPGPADCITVRARDGGPSRARNWWQARSAVSHPHGDTSNARAAKDPSDATARQLG